jgi:G3E family GTPase
MSLIRLPLTLICGLPGSGKTTVIGHLCASCRGQRIGVSRTMAQDETFDEVGRIARWNEFDYLLLEASGTSHPERLATRLAANSRMNAELAELVRLDTIVTVVDASTLVSQFCSWDRVGDLGGASGADDDRALVEVIAEQIEFADVVVLNKSDLATPNGIRNAGVLVRALNPDVVLIECTFGRVPAHKVLSTHSFDFARAQGRARWMRTLAGAVSTELDSHGISSFLYLSRRPFHPERLMNFVRSEWPDVVRCRGFFWLATRMSWMGELAQAGPSRRFRAAGTWWASTIVQQELDPQVMEGLTGVSWDVRFGDRRQQLAFVGIDMDEMHLRRRLDACLLDDREWAAGPHVWQRYRDPFPAWDADAHAPTDRLH